MSGQQTHDIRKKDDLQKLAPVEWCDTTPQARVQMATSMSQEIRALASLHSEDFESRSAATAMKLNHIAWPPLMQDQKPRPLVPYKLTDTWVTILPCNATTAAFLCSYTNGPSRIGILNPADPKGVGHWYRGEKNVETSLLMMSTLSATLGKGLYESGFHPEAVIHSPKVRIFGLTPESSVLLEKGKHLHVDFLSCAPVVDFELVETRLTHGVSKSYKSDSVFAAMNTKVVNILKAAALIGIQTLILVPFGTEAKYGHPVDLVASMFHAALFGKPGQAAINWRSLGIKNVIIAIAGIDTDGYYDPEQKEWHSFRRLFEGQAGVQFDHDARQVLVGISKWMAS